MGFRWDGGVPGNNLLRLCFQPPSPLAPLSTAQSQRGNSLPHQRSLPSPLTSSAHPFWTPVAFPPRPLPHLPAVPAPRAGPVLIFPRPRRSGLRFYDGYSERPQERGADGIRYLPLCWQCSEFGGRRQRRRETTQDSSGACGVQELSETKDEM